MGRLNPGKGYDSPKGVIEIVIEPPNLIATQDQFREIGAGKHYGLAIIDGSRSVRLATFPARPDNVDTFRALTGTVLWCPDPCHPFEGLWVRQSSSNSTVRLWLFKEPCFFAQGIGTTPISEAGFSLTTLTTESGEKIRTGGAPEAIISAYTTTALGGSATFTGFTETCVVDEIFGDPSAANVVGFGHGYTAGLAAFSDVAGTIRPQSFVAGSATARNTGDTALTAGTYTRVNSVQFGNSSWRAQYVNGATAQTTFEFEAYSAGLI